MSTEVLEGLQEEIRAISAPLVERYNAVDKEIADREKDLAALRAARNQLAKVIRGIDPELLPATAPYSRNGSKKKSASKGIAPERLAALTEWLQEHREEVDALNEGRGFHAGGLFRAYGDQIGIPDSTLAVAVKRLHEDGVLRLNGMGNGGAKFYKVV